MNNTTIAKRKSKAFGKDIYLLGQDSEGINYWLEAGKWDCGWYWGFGYIETYTNNKHPENARDINSHQHAEDFYPKWWAVQSDQFKKPTLVSTTFSEAEGWELSELLKQFYLMKEAAEFFGRGKSNMANTSIEDYKKPELVKEINEVRIPQIMERIYAILTPSK